MRLSKLQKFIIITCWQGKRKKVAREEFLEFYDNYKGKKKSSVEDAINIVTKSLIRLIKKNLIVGFGEVTNQRTFIQGVRLTREGRKVARRLLDRQQRLPLRVRRAGSRVKKSEFQSASWWTNSKSNPIRQLADKIQKV